MREPLSVLCPGCKKKFEFYSSPFRPFCSKRCKLVDLGHWLTESYSVAGEKLKPAEFAALYEEENEEEENDSGVRDSESEIDDY